MSDSIHATPYTRCPGANTSQILLYAEDSIVGAAAKTLDIIQQKLNTDMEN